MTGSRVGRQAQIIPMFSSMMLQRRKIVTSSDESIFSAFSSAVYEIWLTNEVQVLLSCCSITSQPSKVSGLGHVSIQ